MAAFAFSMSWSADDREAIAVFAGREVTQDFAGREFDFSDPVPPRFRDVETLAIRREDNGHLLCVCLAADRQRACDTAAGDTSP
jgi:hypothetical protein